MEDEGKQEEKFEFTPEGEALGYISLDQARVLAMSTARDAPGAYGRRLSNVPMAFIVAEAEETEDYYVITLSYRPQGEFSGKPGQEQFFIEKEGGVALRQVLSLPSRARWWRSRVGLVSLGIVVVVAIAVGGVIAIMNWGGSGDEMPLAAVSPATTSNPPTLTAPAAPTTAPVATPPVVATTTPIPSLTPTAVPVPGRTIAPPVAPTSLPSVETAGSTSGAPKGALVFEAKLDGTPDEWDNLGFLGDPEASEVRFRPGAIEMAVLRGGGNLSVSRNSDARLRYVGEVDILVSPGSEVTFWWPLMWGDLRSDESVTVTVDILNQSLQLIHNGRCSPEPCQQQPPDQLTEEIEIPGLQTGRKVTLTAVVDEARYQVYLDGQQVVDLAFPEMVARPTPLVFRVFGRVGVVSLLGARVYEPPASAWIPAGEMLAGRGGHTATLLADGKVLIAGNGPAELYHPVTQTFLPAAQAICGNGFAATANLLADGRVLITGGNRDERCGEVYDPATGRFSQVGDLNADHWGHTATLLADGKVLIAGGSKGQNGDRVSHAVAELYDPMTETFSVTGSLDLDRTGHSATLLSSGQVLITGGESISPGSRTCQGSAELYDPATNSFSPIGGPITLVCGDTATLLNDGNVLITPGDGVALLFDPVTGTFRAGGIMTPRGEHASILLPSGEVLVTGGWIEGPLPPAEGLENIIALATAEVYDPATETFTAIDDMIQARGTHTATLLSNGHVLVVGGRFAITSSSGEVVGYDSRRSAELWIPGNSQ